MPAPTASASPRPTAPGGSTTPSGSSTCSAIDLLCVTAGSPYYCPHVQRPAWFPPSDGYAPPEDPLVGVARMLRQRGRHRGGPPGDDRRGVGPVLPAGVAAPRGLGRWSATAAPPWSALGRMALSYPDLPADVLAGRPLEPRQLCRTFSDCTTAPRNGLVSGCFPLDPFYKEHPDRAGPGAGQASRPWLSAGPTSPTTGGPTCTRSGPRRGSRSRRDAPDDHPWHHGLWFTIKYVNGENFWETYDAYGVLRHVDPTTIHWIRPDRETVVIVEERRLEEVDLGDDDAYALDWTIDADAAGRRACSTGRRSRPGAATAASPSGAGATGSTRGCC